MGRHIALYPSLCSVTFEQLFSAIERTNKLPVWPFCEWCVFSGSSSSLRLYNLNFMAPWVHVFIHKMCINVSVCWFFMVFYTLVLIFAMSDFMSLWCCFYGTAPALIFSFCFLESTSVFKHVNMKDQFWGRIFERNISCNMMFLSFCCKQEYVWKLNVKHILAAVRKDRKSLQVTPSLTGCSKWM